MKKQFTQHRQAYGVDLSEKNDRRAIGWMVAAFVIGLVWMALTR